MCARRGGGKGGGHLPPPGIWKNDVICCRPTKYPKFFARAFGARYIFSIFQSKTAQKTEQFSFAPSARRKWSFFCTARRKRVNFFKCRWFCPPLEIFLRAPMQPNNFKQPKRPDFCFQHNVVLPNTVSCCWSICSRPCIEVLRHISKPHTRN